MNRRNLRNLWIALLCVLCGEALPAQNTTLTGTFKTPDHLTPAAAGLAVAGCVDQTKTAPACTGSVPYYGHVLLTASDISKSPPQPRELTYGGVTYPAQAPRAYIIGDGTIVGANAAAGIKVVPLAAGGGGSGASPSGLAYCAVIFFNRSTDNRRASLTQSGVHLCKVVTNETTLDWAGIAPAALTAPATGYQPTANAAVSGYEDWAAASAPANPAASTGRVWFDTSAAVMKCKTSAGADCMPSGGGGSNHNLLSATHTDTTTGTGVRGDVIVRDATAWARKAIGANLTVMASDGTDAAWTALTASHIPALDASKITTGSFPDARVDDTITASNYLALAGGTLTGTLVARAGATGAGTSPFKFQSGALLTAPEAFAFESDNTALHFTNSGGTRKQLVFADGSITGNAATATALAADPADCSGNNFALGIVASGAATCAQPAFANLSGSITLAQTPLTTEGDILRAGAGPALERLPIGLSGRVLHSNGTSPNWDVLSLSELNAFDSTDLRGRLTDETGTGVAVFGTSPTVTTSLTVSGGTQTTDVKPFNLSWAQNAAGVIFTGPTFATTATAAASGSRALTVDVGGTPRFFILSKGPFAALDGSPVFTAPTNWSVTNPHVNSLYLEWGAGSPVWHCHLDGVNWTKCIMQAEVSGISNATIWRIALNGGTDVTGQIGGSIGSSSRLIWSNSSSLTVGKVGLGEVDHATLVGVNATLFVRDGTAGASTKAIVRAGDTQGTDNLFQLQNNAGTLLSGFNASGNPFIRTSGFDSTISVPALTANRSVTLPDAAGEISLLGQTITAAELSGGFVDAVGDLAAGLCADTEILKKSGGAWACAADATGGSPTWNSIANPAAAQALTMGANNTTWTWDSSSGVFKSSFTSAFSTGTQFLVEQITGNPTGGVLFELKAADPQVTVLQAGDGTNGISLSQAGALTAIGTGTITANSLAVNPADCAADRYATTIAANGDLTCAQVSLTAGVTGTLPVANGGTNATTATAARGQLAVRYGVFCVHGGAYSPADGSVTHFGCNAAQQPGTTEDDTHIMIVPVAGTVTDLWIGGRVDGTLASSETTTCVLRKNAATDSTDLAVTTLALTAANIAVVSDGGGTFTVGAGDRLTMKCTAPTFTTNPTNVRLRWSFSIVQDQ